MSKNTNNASAECKTGCEQQFRDCLNSGEHESVCRMKRVPCDCRCA